MFYSSLVASDSEEITLDTIVSHFEECTSVLEAISALNEMYFNSLQAFENEDSDRAVNVSKGYYEYLSANYSAILDLLVRIGERRTILTSSKS